MSERWEGLRRAFRLPIGRRAVKDEVSAELRFHLEERIEELVASGLSREAAEREARTRFGDLPAIGAAVEEIDRRMVRRRTVAESLEALARDARFGLRALRKSPGFTAVAIATLALGIGANTAIFSAVQGVLLRPLEVPGLDRLFVIQQNAPGLKLLGGQLSPPMIEDVAAHTELFESFAGVSGASFNLTGGGSGEPSRLAGVQTMGRFFEVFGVRPALGRFYRPEDSENGNDHVAVLTDGFWRSWAGGDSGVIGRPIELNGRSYQVIGVLPASFRYRRTAQVYTPIAITPFVRERRGTWSTTAVGRLRPGVSPEQLTAGLARITAEWQSDKGKAAPPEMRWFLSGKSLISILAGELQPILELLMAAVALVLLIACANVANLQLVRAASREKELAVRAAMGAGKWPIMRQLLVENGLIAVAGGGLGVGLGAIALGALRRMDPTSLPALHDLHPGPPVLAYAVGVTALSVLLFGLAPTLKAARADLHGILREASRGSSTGPGRNRLLRLSVMAQVAVSLMLLLGAGLLIRSLSRLLATDPGFTTSRVLTFRVSLPVGTFGPEVQKAAFFDRLTERLAAIPGVESAGGISDLPFGDGRNSSPFTIQGKPVAPGQPERHADMRFVQGAYFRAMGIPLLRGRSFGADDRHGGPMVAVIDQSLARQYFGAENPIGQLVNQGPDATVVGVVGAIKHGDLSEPDKPTIYYAYRQAPWYSGLYLTLRTSLTAEAAIAQAKAAVASLDPNLPLYDIRAMQDRVDQSLGARRLAMLVLTGFAALALLLALLGVYGVLSYSTSRRTHELGIRLALGAVPGDMVRMVLGSGLTLAMVGIAAGLAGFLAVARLLSAILYGVTPHDPVTIVAGVGVLAICAALAAYLPARRAARVDPVQALRDE
jgi:putative ABC transport system permease protein